MSFELPVVGAPWLDAADVLPDPTLTFLSNNAGTRVVLDDVTAVLDDDGLPFDVQDNGSCGRRLQTRFGGSSTGAPLEAGFHDTLHGLTERHRRDSFYSGVPMQLGRNS